MARLPNHLAFDDETFWISAVLGGSDLDAPPRWQPSADVFGGPPLRNGRGVVLRVLTETSAHSGHLDIVRELLADHQNLVVR